MNPADIAGEDLAQVGGHSDWRSAAAISQAPSASRGSSSNTPSPGEESLGSGATDGDDGDDASGYWLLCAVICSGTGLYVGEGQLGDLFCMLHTSDGVCRSRTAVTGMVYSNANPSWPSNGNGNAFVLPVRRSKRQTDLVITVWDGSESLEEAIPVGKVHVNLQEYMQFPVLPPGKDTPDDPPPRYAFEVDLVPRLSAISQTPARLTVMLERASPAFEGDGAKDQALHDLLRRLGIARKRDRLKKLMQWDREYTGNGGTRGGSGGSQTRDYSLVSLLTADPASSGGEDGASGGGSGALEIPWGGRRGEGYPGGEDDRWAEHNSQEVEVMMEQLSRSWGGEGEGGCAMASVPVRAQAALAARIKHMSLQDGCMVMEKGTAPTSFFYIVRGACLVTVGGEEVNRLEAGQFLGEIGVIYESTRLADVRAIGDTQVLVLNGDDLSLALDMFPGLYRELQEVAEKRLDRVQKKETWGKGGCEHSSIGTSSEKGPLLQFLNYLKNVAHDDLISNDERALHPSRMHSRFDAHSMYSTKYPSGVPIGNFDQMVKSSSLDSIMEADANSAASAVTSVAGSAHAHLSDHLHEQALSARLASMEKSAFGPGIEIPTSKKHVSPTYGGSLRMGVVKNVGSLEHARNLGGSHALSPMGNHWDRDISSSDSGQGSDSEGSEYDGGASDADGGSGGTSRADLSSAIHTSPSEKESAPSGVKRARGNRGADGAAGDDSVGVEGAHAPAGEDGESPSRTRSEQDKKKGARHGKKPRPRKSMFRIRFRKAHDTYTAEELGATPRRLRRVTLSGVCVRGLREHDIQAYFTVEAAPLPGEHTPSSAREPLLQSEVVRGDKAQQEVAWNKLATVDLEDEMLFPDQRLCFSIYQKRQLWSTKVLGHAFVSLRDAFCRQGVSMQSTYQIFKEKDEADRRSRDKSSGDGVDSSIHSVSSGISLTPTSSSSTSSTLARSWSGGNLFRRAKPDTDDEESGGKVRGYVTMTWLVEDSIKLPFCLSVPPLRAGQRRYDIVDHLGVVVAKLEYVGRSRCAWCTKIDQSQAFYVDYSDPEAGPQEEPCCNACSIKGWSECVTMWDKKGADCV